jgi:hypothetical protein
VSSGTFGNHKLHNRLVLCSRKDWDFDFLNEGITGAREPKTLFKLSFPRKEHNDLPTPQSPSASSHGLLQDGDPAKLE